MSLEQLDLDGTLVIEPSARDPNLDYLQRRRLPMVAIGKPSGVCGGVPYVDIHSALTTGRLLDHLHVQGASLKFPQSRRHPGDPKSLSRLRNIELEHHKKTVFCSH